VVHVGEGHSHSHPLHDGGDDNKEGGRSGDIVSLATCPPSSPSPHITEREGEETRLGLSPRSRLSAAATET